MTHAPGPSGQHDEEVLRYLERFAMVMADSGYPRMAARVFAAILVSDEGRRTAAELADLLGVGAPAISGGVKYLMNVGMVVRERLPGERRDSYRVRDGAWYSTISETDVFRQWEEVSHDGVEILGPGSPAGSRLHETERFFAFLRKEIPALMAKWDEQRRTV
ncbi:GbsR/MarR family transcriptional regulator [Nocardiopsis sediminis]|uniref:GbsR/MarR family transcriptional regulator n=1 Tax=Nocardiopsis sediminis TaxID=1778267 RepID=A0ABV8FW25_9ACTN